MIITIIAFLLCFVVSGLLDGIIFRTFKDTDHGSLTIHPIDAITGSLLLKKLKIKTNATMLTG